MAVDDVEICNLALGAIGAATITDLTDTTAEGYACNRLYARTLQSLLVKYDWPFAQKLLTLGTENNIDPVGGWTYEYDLPADFLRAIRVEEEGFDPKLGVVNGFEIRGETILTNVEDAFLLYIMDFTDTTKFPISFEEALVALLASKLAMPLTGDPLVRQKMEQDFLRAVIDAKAEYADEPTQLPLQGTFLTAGN